ncbi:hypothetical protein [Pseudovibrio sp. SPO723]|uniref:hypothetical protein n=1 Tax=Nesiotobacter zosterae TaxID=392721 RepID=UPI0029C58649|nr:hypothetical protein [Pseudovibrio sp. SPO723]MDX5592548.1 hypothetical protein [Pseudovibrio sp. SPO723]
MINIIAIDPGLSGGWAAFAARGELLDAGDLPTTGEGSKREIDSAELTKLIISYHSEAGIVERVSAMPGQGVSSMFRFGAAYGACKAVIQANGLPLHLVTPQKWKKAMGIASKSAGGAEEARQKAIHLFPNQSFMFKRKKDHNAAEAALIGAYFLKSQGEAS